RSYAKPFSSSDAKILNAMMDQKAYLAKAGDLARNENKEWKLQSSDAQNRYHLSLGKSGWELTTYLTLRRASDKDNGILMREKFTLDSSGKTLVKQERSWEAAAGSNAAALQATLNKLNATSLPSQAEAQAYVNALLPVLTPTLASAPAAAPTPAATPPP